MTLEAGTKLGRYEIREKLGAGGMGEVYLAHDGALDRRVALKILPADLAAKKDRMDRFVREAKAAAALNHPNIAHIYEIGESDGINFIAMEFVEGDTLRQLIHGKPTELKKLLRYLQHSAEALAKAHATGIVHRDLKPDNIMVTREGHAKILDFGLAKLIEPQLADPSKAGKEEQITAIMQQHSTPGVIMGTIGYMSPEQARGDVREIDHRSDIFSFGCILFEAATKQKPFTGDSMVKSLHKIIYEPAPAVGDVNPNAPADLQRIVRRCLAKDPDDRYQTIKDVAIELRELRRELETGPALAQAVVSSSSAAGVNTTPVISQGAATSLESQTAILPSAPSTDSLRVVSQTALTGGSMAAASRRNRIVMFGVTAAIGLVGLSIAAFMLWRSNHTPPFARVKVTRITANGKASSAAISPDGRYIVHAVSDAGLQSLELRQVATNTNLEILAPAEVYYSSLTFSQDGNYIYYLMFDRNRPTSGLYRKPVLGGEATRIVTNIVSRPSLSPDGKSLAFLRSNSAELESAVMIINVDGSGERKIASCKLPDLYRELAWSPKGDVIAVSAITLSGTQRGSVVTIPASGGDAKTLSSRTWFGVDQLAWTGDGAGLIVSAIEQSFGARQLFYVAYPTGDVRPVTSDLNDYTVVSVTADASSLVTVAREVVTTVWTAPVNPNGLSASGAGGPAIDRSRSRQITQGGRKLDGYNGVAWTNDGRITYTSNASGNNDIWIMEADGTGQKQLTSETEGTIYHSELYQSVSPDGRYILFTSDRAGSVPHIWRMDANGNNLKQLTNGAGEALQQVTPDGRSVVYFEITSKSLSKVSIDGGEPTRITDKVDSAPFVSPDGKLIAFLRAGNATTSTKIAIVSSDGGALVKSFDAPPNGDSRRMIWTPDGRALVYVEVRGGISNLWMLPVDGGAPTQLTDFRADRIYAFDFSRDGKWVVMSRGNSTNDVVLFSNVK